MNRMAARIKIFDLGKMLSGRGNEHRGFCAKTGLQGQDRSEGDLASPGKRAQASANISPF
jgi:hypothetical protein